MNVELNGQSIYYEIEGDTGTPVLLVMGFGMSGQAWLPQVKELQQHHRVLWFDNRGIGRSEISKTPYRLTDLANDTKNLLDHVGWEKVHLVGVSMGGMIAQQLAVTHPSRIKSLSLIATLPTLRLGLRKRKREYAPSPKGLFFFLKANLSKGEKRLATLRRLLFSQQYIERSEGDHGFNSGSMEAFAVPADRWTLKNQLQGILTFDQRDKLPGLKDTPTLILRPEEDLLVSPKNSDLLHHLIPDSRLISFPLAGHGLTQECSTAVNQVLLEHFAGADGQSDSFE